MEHPMVVDGLLVTVSEATLQRLSQFDRLKRRVRNLRTAVKDLGKAYDLARLKNEVLKIKNQRLETEASALREQNIVLRLKTEELAVSE